MDTANQRDQQCPNADHMGEHACADRSQCFEPCGDLGHSEAHAVAHEDRQRDRLLAVVRKVIAWNERYPSSRIYPAHMISVIAAEMDEINHEARAVVADIEAGQ